MTNETSPPPISSDELLRAAQRGRHDPLLSCLIEVARLHGRSMSPDSFLAGLPLPEGRLTPSVFRRAAARAADDSRSLGLSAYCLLRYNGSNRIGKTTP